LQATEILRLTGAVPHQSRLHPVDWTIRPGQHWVISGPRASGKSLLAQGVANRRRLVSGECVYPFLNDGLPFEKRRSAIRLVTFMDEASIAVGRDQGHYYQQRFNAFDRDGHPTVRRYLAAGGNNPDDHLDLFELIGITHLLDLEKIKLSSGQTRKVLLARELLGRPQLLVIDNPYVGLDPAARRIVNQLLDDLVERLGLTLVLAGHYVELPACITHRLHLSPEGRAETGPIGQFRRGNEKILANEAALSRIKSYWHKVLTENDHFSEVIRLENVSVSYGDRTVFKNLNWTVNRGEKWRLHGPNGSGKSTILSLIYADNPQAYARRIFLFGQRRGAGQSIWEVKRRIGFTSPEFHTYFREPITAYQTVLTGLTDTFTPPREPDSAQLDMADALFNYFRIGRFAGLQFNDLSSGTQRLVLLLRALIKAPPVLLLDEPYQGLDANDITRANVLLEELLGARDTLLFVSHYGAETPRCVDRELLLG